MSININKLIEFIKSGNLFKNNHQIPLYVKSKYTYYHKSAPRGEDNAPKDVYVRAYLKGDGIIVQSYNRRMPKKRKIND